MLRSCGTQPMPAAARWCGGSAVTSRPASTMRPAWRRVTPTSVLSSVVLPVPLRPSSASESALVEREVDALRRRPPRRSRRAGRSTRSSSAMRRLALVFAEVDRLDARIAGDRSARRPRRTRAPLTSTVTVRAKLKTRSMSCSISSTETSAGSASIVSKISWRSPAGTPATGSSSSSTRGRQASAMRDLEQAPLAVGERARPAGPSRRRDESARAALSHSAATRGIAAERRQQPRARAALRRRPPAPASAAASGR